MLCSLPDTGLHDLSFPLSPAPSAVMKKIHNVNADKYEHGAGYYLRNFYPLYPGFIDFSAPHFLRRYYENRKSRRSIISIAANLIVFLIFRFRYLLRFRIIARRYDLGSSWTKNARAIAKNYFIDPHDIALFRINNADDINNNMRRFEDAHINRFINPKGWRKDCILGDKIAFHNLCADHNLPHPQILATAFRKRLDIYELPSEQEFILKPAGGNGGRKFTKAIFNPQQQNARAHFEDKIRALTKGSRECWIAQPRLRNHSALLPLAQSALITARVTTMLNEQGVPEIVTSVLRFPSTSETFVDNIKSGGAMALIDLASGRLGQACFGRSVGELTHHPVSGIEIARITIPNWPEVKALVLEAHRKAFGGYSIIGWDVAPTNDGAILLEGDGRPGIIIAQRGHGKGIGEMRIGELIAYHINQRLTASD